MPTSAVPPSGSCEFRCLGPVVLTGRDRRPLPLRTRKQLALLLYLARRPGRPVGRDELIELLWSADAERPARHSLSQSASLINKSLGCEAIVTAGRDRLVAVPGAVWLDVTEFERLAGEGRRDEALALWRGHLLEGTWVQRAPHFERWLHEERDRLQRMFRRIAHARLEELRTGGSHATMRDEAERLLVLDPLDEKAMLVHLEALTLLDDRTLALRRYGEFEKRLRKELDAEPGSALRTWARRQRRGDGGAAARRPLPLMRVSEVMVLPTPQPLFGRTEEFAILWDGWEQAKIGKGSFIILEGEAGIGKTALATKLVNQAHVAGGSVCFVKCYRTEKSVPFAPVTALIRQLCRLPGFVGLDPVWIGELTRLVPELRDRYPGAPTPMAVDDAARHRLSDATVQAALAVADELPLMIVVDDLQDADEASLAVMHYLCRQRDTPILILGIYRSGQTQSEYERVFIETAKAGRLVQIVQIRGLALLDVRKLVLQVAASRGLDAQSETVLTVANSSKGNPLHAIEAVIAAVQPQPPHGGQGDNPSTTTQEIFDATAMERFGALVDGAKHVASTLAVAGHPLNEFQLADLTRLKPADLAMALTLLENNQFVSRVGAKVGLAHERYATAIEAALTPDERTHLHSRLARLLAREAASNPAIRFEAARHFEASGDRRHARIQAKAAARFAALVGAVRSEAEALELIARSSHADRQQVGFSLGQCYLELNEFAKLDALCHSMTTEANQSPSESCELDYLRIAAGVESGAAPMTDLQQRLGGVLARGVAFPHDRMAQVLLMRIADKTGDYALARRTARNLRRSGPRGQLDRHALLAAGYIFTKYFYAARALSLLERAMEVAQRDSDWATECFCRDCLGIALKQTGRFRDSIDQFNTSLALARKTMNPNGEARCLQNRAVSEMALGDWTRVFATLDEADALPHASWGFRTFNVYNRAVSYMATGEFNRALQFFTEASELATHHAIRSMAADATAGMALASIRSGDWSAFEKLSRQAICIENPVQAPRVGWSVPTVAAWRQAVIDGDAVGAIASLAIHAQRALRVDVAFGLALELERLLLLEHTTGKRAELDRKILRKRATHYAASAIADACL